MWQSHNVFLVLCSSRCQTVGFHSIALCSCGRVPNKLIFHRAHFDALPAHLAVEAHEQDRVASCVLLGVLELSAASEEKGERHRGQGLRRRCVNSLARAAVCEAHVDDVFVDDVLASTGTA